MRLRNSNEEEENMANVVIMDHPLIQHKIGLIRRKETGTKDFRQTIGEIAMLICYEATRDLKMWKLRHLYAKPWLRN